MEGEDRFKQVFLALIVAMIGLKWFLVPLILIERLMTIELRILAEIRLVVPTAALLLGAAQVARRGRLRLGVGVELMFAVLGLGWALAIVEAAGPSALLDPVAAITAAPLALFVGAALWSVHSLVAWMFGGWIVGTLFWSRPGLDDRSPAPVDRDDEGAARPESAGVTIGHAARSTRPR